MIKLLFYIKHHTWIINISKHNTYYHYIVCNRAWTQILHLFNDWMDTITKKLEKWTFNGKLSFTTSTVSLHLKLKHWNIHVFTSTNYFLYFLRNNRLWFIVLKKLTGLKLHDQVLTSLSIGRNHQQPKINQRLPEIIMIISDLHCHIRRLGYFFFLTHWCT